MGTTMAAVDDKLIDWRSVAERFRTDDVGLFLGNGASQSVWSRFSYKSLYEFACMPERTAALLPGEQAIFEEMKTTNFEHVLWALSVTKVVCTHLNKPCDDVAQHYERIRQSLIHAVRDVHIPFEKVTEDVKDKLRRYFRFYDYIYTTNYDLLPYWSIMEDEMQFKDFLWYDMFNPADAHVWGNVTKILFLHGALHLYHDLSGNTIKKQNDPEKGDILSQFYIDENLIPLFVSEGDSEDKLKSIRRNDYLSFAYWKLAFHRGHLVVFGSSLSEKYDKHIINAMVNWKNYDRKRTDGQKRRMVAISMLPTSSSSQIIAEKNRLISALPHCDLYFYDSSTHFLSDPRLKIAA